MTRRAYLLEEQKLIVFWSPKAACTSVAKAVARDVLKLDEDPSVPFRGGDRKVLEDQGYFISGEKAMAIREKNPEIRAIVLIRDPYDRLISAFINKFVSYKGIGLDAAEKLEPFSRAFYRREIIDVKHNPTRGKEPYKGFTFRDFISAICERIAARPEGAEPDLNDHWNSQIPFSFFQRDFRYDHVFAMEDSAKFFDKLSQLTNVEVTQPRLNSSTYSEEANSENLVDLNSISLSRIDNVAKENFYDEELKKTVKRHFNVDYHYYEIAKTSII